MALSRFTQFVGASTPQQVVIAIEFNDLKSYGSVSVCLEYVVPNRTSAQRIFTILKV